MERQPPASPQVPERTSGHCVRRLPIKTLPSLPLEPRRISRPFFRSPRIVSVPAAHLALIFKVILKHGRVTRHGDDLRDEHHQQRESVLASRRRSARFLEQGYDSRRISC